MERKVAQRERFAVFIAAGGASQVDADEAVFVERRGACARPEFLGAKSPDEGLANRLSEGQDAFGEEELRIGRQALAFDGVGELRPYCMELSMLHAPCREVCGGMRYLDVEVCGG